MTTETTDQFALAVLLELRREYAYTQRKLSLWMGVLLELNGEKAKEATRGVRRPSAEQILSARERVYTLRVEIAQLQRDIAIAIKECQRLELSIPEDLSGYYGEWSNVKSNK